MAWTTENVWLELLVRRKAQIRKIAQTSNYDFWTQCDETVFLVPDPHFGVIDDAGYDPVYVCVECFRDYVNIQWKMSNSRCSFYVDARHYARSELFLFNLGSMAYVPSPIPHDLSSRENCHFHLRQKSIATVPRPLSSSFGDVPVQARPKRKVVYLSLRTILQFFGE